MLYCMCSLNPLEEGPLVTSHSGLARRGLATNALERRPGGAAIGPYRPPAAINNAWLNLAQAWKPLECRWNVIGQRNVET